MTKFEFPETSPRIFRPAPMVELDVGVAGADAKEGEAVTGAAAAFDDSFAGVAAGGSADGDVAAGTDASAVLTDEIAF
jgi:hypothetical protein